MASQSHYPPLSNVHVKETEKGEACRYQGIVSSILLEGLKSKGTSPIEMEIESEIVSGCGVLVVDDSKCIKVH